MKYIILALIALITSCSEAPVESEPTFNLNMVEIMENAQYKQTQYRSVIYLNSPLIIKNVQPYVYNKTTSTLTQLKSVKLRNRHQFTLNYEQQFNSDIVLIFFAKRVGFSFNDKRPAQLLCYLEVKETYIAEKVNCDFKTTTTYLLASLNNNDAFINTQTIDRWLMYNDESLLNNQTYQNILASLSTPLIYMARYPRNLTLAMTKDDYLVAFKDFYARYIHRISVRRYADIDSFEQELVSISPAFKNFGYKVSQDHNIILSTATHSLPLVEEHSRYVDDFFAGKRDLKFINKSALKLVDINYTKATNEIHFKLWPWMNYVEVNIDGKQTTLSKTVLSLPKDFKRITLLPKGEKGQFVESIITPLSLSSLTL